MKFIRIKGLAAFVVFAGLLSVVWLLVVDGLIERFIERTGTSLVGAKVELREADLSIFPLGLTLAGLDVTDPHRPMENLVHADRIAFLMDFRQLLFGKLIVDEMTIDGVKTATPRKVSGALQKKEKKKREKKEVSKTFSLPALRVPRVDEILEKEELESLERINAMKADIEKKKAHWEKKIKELPDDEKIDEYKRRIKAIEKGLKGKGTEILAAVNDASRLQKDIESDLKKIKRTRKSLAENLKSLEKDIKALQTLPQKDLKRLKSKYALSAEGLGNFSKLLFGGKIAERTNRLMSWYEKAEPIAEKMSSKKKEEKPVRAKGVNIRFPEYKPQPDLHVKLARTTLDIPAGLLKGEIRNITDNQSLVGSPTTLLFSGRRLKGLDSAEIKGEINRLDPENPFEKGWMKTKGYKLKEVALSSSGDFPLEMKSALLDGSLDFIREEESVRGDFSGNFRETAFTAEAEKKGLSDLASLLLSSLKEIKAFKLEGTVTAYQGDYNVKLSSDLDRIMKKAVGKKVEQESRRFTKELEKAIKDKVSRPLADLKKGSRNLQDIDKMLAGRLEDLEHQLASSQKLSPKGFNLKF